MIEGPVTDDITSETGGATESIGLCFDTWVITACDLRSVRHLQDIRHVAGCRNVQNRRFDITGDNVENLSNQQAGADSYSFARFEIDLDVILVL